ncbi:MAG TPA: FliH/SctL family protein [Candidatus Acidoferrum sp.]|nr:FliH/SctL family protein [Candidatus Acidoferrum sp.]
MTKVIKARFVQLGRGTELDCWEVDMPAPFGYINRKIPESAPQLITMPTAKPDDSADKVSAILKAARDEAAQMLTAANKEVKALWEEARALGYEEGKMQAIADANLEIGETVSEISALLSSLEEQKAGMLRNYEGKIRDLAISVAKKVIQTEMDQHNEVFLNIYKGAAQELRDQEWIRLSVSDMQVQFATENADTLMSLVQGAKHIEIVGLPEAPAGTCILETPTGIVDASLDTQMDKIKDAFADVEMLIASSSGDIGPFAD